MREYLCKMFKRCITCLGKTKTEFEKNIVTCESCWDKELKEE